MASTKAMKVLAYVMLALTFLATLQTAEAYHEHRTFYDDPQYYSGRYYAGQSYYTHHQYHVIAYRDHYRQYNQYYHYPPPRYYRYNYYPEPRCQYPGDVCY
ncbi:hypothetical protein J4208_01945 [Candidatus Woesearchaeota archaeon]|nr:hypothetical protein [Candidatus Woesearchaeota archaeon]